MQPCQIYYITHHEELGISWLTQMKDDYFTKSCYLTYTLFSLEKVGRMYFFNLGVKGIGTCQGQNQGSCQCDWKPVIDDQVFTWLTDSVWCLLGFSFSFRKLCGLGRSFLNIWLLPYGFTRQRGSMELNWEWSYHWCCSRRKRWGLLYSNWLPLLWLPSPWFCCLFILVIVMFSY